KASVVSSARFQYPLATLGPEIQISPTWLSRQGVRVLGSAITTTWLSAGVPLPARGLPGMPGGGSAISPWARALGSTESVTAGEPALFPETSKVASASP